MTFKHLQDVGETYTEHFQFSLLTGFKLMATGVMLIIHGLMPNIFVSSASKNAHALIDKLAKRQDLKKSADA